MSVYLHVCHFVQVSARLFKRLVVADVYRCCVYLLFCVCLPVCSTRLCHLAVSVCLYRSVCPTFLFMYVPVCVVCLLLSVCVSACLCLCPPAPLLLSVSITFFVRLCWSVFVCPFIYSPVPISFSLVSVCLLIRQCLSVEDCVCLSIYVCLFLYARQ